MSDEGEGSGVQSAGGAASERLRRARPRDTMLTVLRTFWRLWGLLAFLLLLLIWFRGIVLPFIFATLVAYLLEPLVRRMAPRLGDRRGLSVVLLYLALVTFGFGFLGGVLPGVVSDLSTLRESTPSAMAKINEEWLPRVSTWFEETFPGMLGPEPEVEREQVSELIVQPQPDGSYRVDLSGAHLEVHESSGGWVIETSPKQKANIAELLRDIIASKGDELTEAATEAVRAVISGIASFVTDLIITFLIAGFILVDLDRVKHFVRSLVPNNHRADFENIVRGIDEGMAGAIRGQLLICLVNGTLAFIGLYAFGVRYSLLLAMVAAVLSIIPVFGILISAIPLLGVALVSGDAGLEGLEFGKSAGILGWIVGIHLLEANYLNQRVIGTADIHPVILIFALLAGWEVYGPIGAVLALPVASMIQTVFLYARKQSTLAAREAEGRDARDANSSDAIRFDTARHRALSRSEDDGDEGS
ncbi:pheromone autoinducer 2 transporter [Enhygromyxa salina]|uniref:Pheromone autoinducer 2 transporter n=1 Tax=Enhygromyxa salina TaxID=215803 RepID=A0A2S9XE09_9BACT|nr:AI-2E family transporter [Enhygromyxa salina]PRP91000.1 pheromone autoinducer 2 transporter [Enhygromyxa salina]